MHPYVPDEDPRTTSDMVNLHFESCYSICYLSCWTWHFSVIVVISTIWLNRRKDTSENIPMPSGTHRVSFLIGLCYSLWCYHSYFEIQCNFSDCFLLESPLGFFSYIIRRALQIRQIPIFSSQCTFARLPTQYLKMISRFLIFWWCILENTLLDVDNFVKSHIIWGYNWLFVLCIQCYRRDNIFEREGDFLRVFALDAFTAAFQLSEKSGETLGKSQKKASCAQLPLGSFCASSISKTPAKTEVVANKG